MRIDQFFKNRSLSENKTESNIIEWQTLDESKHLSDEQIHDDCMAFVRGEPIPGILEFYDPVCARKNMKSGAIDFLLEDNEIPFPENSYLQIQHPNTWEWHLIDREKGRITESSEKSFKDVPVIYAD